MDAPSIPPPSPGLSMHKVTPDSNTNKDPGSDKAKASLLTRSRHRAECLAPVNPWHLLFEWSWWFVYGKQTWSVLGISAALQGLQCNPGAVCGPGCNAAWESTNATAGRSFIVKFRVFCSHLHRDLPSIWGLSLILFGVSLCVLVCVCAGTSFGWEMLLL